MNDATRGVLWMSGAVLSFSAMAVAARELLQHMGPFQILFVRSAIMLAIVLVVIAQAEGAVTATRRLPLHLLRKVVHFGGQYCWVFAIGVLPLATVFAIEFTMPVWTAILAALILGERLTPNRIAMLALGLLGVLIILRPGFGLFHTGALVALLASLFYAGNMIATKRLTATDSPLAILFWMSVIQTPLSLLTALPQWVAPPAADLPWMFVMGLGSINTLSATAGIASLRDVKHMEEERAENARVREFTLQAFRDMGFEGTNAHTNCVFVDIKRPAKEFRDACAAQKVRVGRDFPPFEKSHTRISLGTMDEMKRAVGVFRQVLTASTASRAQQ
jgi:drug/metabolite transporter (DMT)-like permease